MIKENEKKRIIFDLPEGVIISSVINEILKENGIQESPQEYSTKMQRGDETNFMIVRDAAIVLFEKKIPKEKLTEVLAKHLKTSGEAALKIVQDIEKKLVTYMKVIPILPEEPYKKPVDNGPSTQELLLEKIKSGREDSQSPDSSEYLPETKKVEVKDVEKNAEQLKQQREETTKPGTVGGQTEKGQSDKYREPIE